MLQQTWASEEEAVGNFIAQLQFTPEESAFLWDLTPEIRAIIINNFRPDGTKDGNMLGRLQGYTRSVLQRQGLPIPHSLAVENIARPEEANWSTALAPAPMANAGYAASPWDPWSFASRLGLNDEGAQFLASLPEELLKASIQSFDPAGTKDGNVWGRLLGFIRGLWMKRLQLNEEAISCVKNLSEEALMQVMISFHPGPKDGNLSARLIAFAKNLSWSGPMQHQGSYEQQWQDPSAAMPTPSPSAPISYAPPRAQARSASSVIWELATYWQLDQGCIDFLMQLPDEIKWEISTGFNPWGAKDGNIWGRLLGFIRVLVAQWVGWDRAKVEYMKTLPEEQQKEMILTSLSAVYQGYTNQAVWSPARPSAPSGTPTLKQFVDRWGLDERAGQFLQALPHHVLQVVLSAFDASASADGNVWGRLLGFVRSTWGRTLKLPLEEVSHLKTMPDLVQVQIITEYDPAGGMRLVDFANQMLQASGMASEMPALPAPVPPVDPQAVDAFIVRCGLDASARDMLMALPPEKLNHVMETFNPDGTKDGNVLGRLEGYIRSMSVFRQGAKRARIY
mmetsp:Transcript_20054/g.47151  ORF Transcript_20054/g.47151 Transcript_20054/m.47151 type:complete len:564 (+) Transcript_20054:57-1748(+)